MIGQRFGRLVVVSDAGRRGHNRLWLCRCDCGGEASPTADNLRRGKARSCGCLKRDSATAASTIHGRSDTREFNSWVNMRQRCLNPNNPAYDRYGGRGIAVCERWQRFENFLADMGPKPGPTFSLDRIDNDGNYEPGNCRWASDSAQSKNRRVFARGGAPIEFRGEVSTVCLLAKRHGFKTSTIYKRLASGWDIERALTTPRNPNRATKRAASSTHTRAQPAADA